MKIYRTRTKEEYDWLMKELESVGYKWNTGEFPTESKIKNEDKGNVIVYEKRGEPLTFDYVKDVDAMDLSLIIEVSELMKEEDPLAKKIEERNNKPIPTIQDNPEGLAEQLKRVFPEDDPIKPKHYENNGKDLFDELYDRLYHSKKMFTGREVFIIVMKFVAERYTRRYPNKNPEDLGKGIYTLERLKEYEEIEK